MRPNYTTPHPIQTRLHTEQKVFGLPTMEDNRGENPLSIRRQIIFLLKKSIIIPEIPIGYLRFLQVVCIGATMEVTIFNSSTSRRRIIFQPTWP